MADNNKKAPAPKEPTADEKLAAAEEALRLQEIASAEQEQRIADLEAQAAKTAVKAKGSNNLPTVEHDGKNYRFRYPKLNFGNGRKLTADEIAEDGDLVAQLIENGSAALEEV